MDHSRWEGPEPSGIGDHFIANFAANEPGHRQSPGATSETAKFKAVAYADSTGAPGSLLSSGTEVVGCTSGSTLTGALVTPQSLTAGTPCWIGFITDTSVILQQADSGTSGYKASNTYASGAPGTAPAMTGGQASWLLYGNVSGITGHNWLELDNNPALGDLSSVYSDNRWSRKRDPPGARSPAK